MPLRQSLVAIALSLGACTGDASSQSLVALPNVTIVDGTGAPPQPRMTVLVEDGRITAIFPAGSRALPEGTVELDVAGSYVIPGLIDAHVHLASFERDDTMLNAILRFALLGGVTTVRDMGGNTERVLQIARVAQAHGALSPRVYASAVFAGPRWFAEYDSTRVRYWSGNAVPGTASGVRQIDESTNLEEAVRLAASLGVWGIKLYSDIAPDQLADLGRLTRKHGLELWSHAVVPPSRPDEVVAAGVTSLSHADQLIWTNLPSGDAGIGDRAERARLMSQAAGTTLAMDSLYAAMRRSGTLLEPTLLVMQAGGIQDGRFAPLGEVAAWAVAATRRAYRAGVGIVAGTDGIGRQTPWIHVELQLLVQQVGMTPLEAIQAATQHGARALGIEDSAGTIAPGKWADLLVLRADPTTDIRNTQTVHYVIRGGTVHERNEPWMLGPGAERPPP